MSPRPSAAKKALDDLTLTVPQGAVYGLVGSNGAGKTTAIRHITGIFRPDSGSVTIGGLPVYENPPGDQKPHRLYPGRPRCVWRRDAPRAAAFYRAMYPRFDAKRFDALRDVFRLDERTPLRRFSKGMQKHAAFWLTLSMRPDYLILDEPVDGIDPVMRRQIWSLVVEDVAGYGMTGLVSSHNLRELEDICDHVGMMHAGRMLLERSLAELQENIVKVQLVTDQPLPEDLCSPAREHAWPRADAHHPRRARADGGTSGRDEAAAVRPAAAESGGNFHVRAGRERI